MDPKSVKKILVPTDFSEAAEEALTTAIAFARAFQASVDLLHVFPEPAYILPPPLELAAFPLDTRKVIEEVERSLERMQRRVEEAGLPCQSVTLTGRAPAEIVSYAESTGSDLIVMATHGRGGFGHAILGSVAERVVHRAPCPVLIVPGPAKR